MSRVVQLNAPARGSAFTRMVMAEIAHSKGREPDAYAMRRWGPDALATKVAQMGGAEFLAVEKANVTAGATVSGNWANLLADAEGAAAEFFALVRERSLIGRIPGLRRVPLRTRLIRAETGFSAAWVGEGDAKPLSSATYAQETLDPRKVVALTVVTDELLEASDPLAETVIRDDLVAAVSAAIDQSFIDPANAGSAGVEPASVTNGITAISAGANGVDAEGRLFDVRDLIEAFPGDLERAVLIGSPRTFSIMYNPQYLPGLGVRGGSALGIPAIASTAAGDTLALIDPDGIAVGSGTTDVRVSTQGAVQMLDNPTIDSVAPTATTTVSLWQTDSAAVMAEQRVNWQVVRPSVAVLDGVAES